MYLVHTLIIIIVYVVVYFGEMFATVTFVRLFGYFILNILSLSHILLPEMYSSPKFDVKIE